MLKNKGAAAALAAMVALGGYGAWISFSSQEHKSYEKTHNETAAYKYLGEFWNWTTRDPISFYTFVLAIFTGVVGATAIKQIGYLRKADETARISANAASSAAEAAQKQMLLTGKQADIFEKQHAVGRLQYLAANPPRFQIRFIHLLPADQNEPPDEQSVRVDFELFNNGGNAAVVTGSYIAFGFIVRGEWPHPNDLRTLDIGTDLICGPNNRDRRFEAGTGDRYIASGGALSGLLLAMGEDTAGVLYLIGWVVYRDDGNTTRTFYFCREYSPTTQRFTPAKDCDYESYA